MQDAGGAHHHALAQEGSAEGDRGGHAGEEDEHVCGVAEPEARRNVVPEEIAAAMGDEDNEHRAAAKEIEARVAALAEHRSLSLRHRVNLAAARRESAGTADSAPPAPPPGGAGPPGLRGLTAPQRQAP